MAVVQYINHADMGQELQVMFTLTSKMGETLSLMFQDSVTR